MKLFPILNSQHDSLLRNIPWDLLEPHRAQALINHCGQDLERLFLRNGLSTCEALAVIEDRPWRKMEEHEADLALMRMILEHAEKS